MSRKKFIWAWVGAAAVLAMLAQLSPRRDPEGPGVVEFALARSGTAQPAVADAVETSQGDLPETKIESLPCFRCHNIERYRDGEEFAHSKHENAGHCHVCHAFEGHFQATIRRKACEGCH